VLALVFVLVLVFAFFTYCKFCVFVSMN
jgi:hypothetical protein